MNFSSFNFSKSVGIVVVIGLLILAFVAYMMVRGKASEGTVIITDGPVSESEATFVTLAGELDSIVFDTGILADARFLALQDIHTAILPETLGRLDPFAPAGRR
ncbi:MAG TPA: hypothetical protein VFY28_03260 [Candidatus Paceibacterota bacterium]|nr:hypothetical protein [Candidatus Paceibacterota bacterium]